ncbi:glycosyltransferase [Patescibacteria group bacterium]|nr:glycosyltransferase [Patescibacteria group bacterium]
MIFWFPYDIYHCVSRYTMNSLRIYYGVPDQKLKMIYNGVDYEFWDPDKVSKDQIALLRKKY